MPNEINLAFLDPTSNSEMQFPNEEKLQLKPMKPANRLNSLFSHEDIISPVSDVAKQARIELENEYKHSVSKSKTVVNATNLFSFNRSRLPR
ncbi:MAG: hypothetical protein ACE14V_08485 [bacterium]